MNTELLEQVVTKLRRMRHAEHFSMPAFAERTDCGTAFCIAGLGLALSGYRPIFGESQSRSRSFRSPEKKSVWAWPAAQRLFGLTFKQADRLFNKSRWPEEFEPGSYDDDPKVAAARIEHFLKTKGKE